MTERPRPDFETFFVDAEPRLRRALTAAYGPDRGREATAESLAYAWQHWDRIRAMPNPLGYLFRVGQSRTRARRIPIGFPDRPESERSWPEPALPSALLRLSERERLAVVLIEGFSWTHREVADVAGVSKSAVQSYLERGLRKLRAELGVTDGA